MSAQQIGIGCYHCDGQGMVEGEVTANTIINGTPVCVHLMCWVCAACGRPSPTQQQVVAGIHRGIENATKQLNAAKAGVPAAPDGVKPRINLW